LALPAVCLPYARKRLIDYQLGGRLLLVTIPLALLGTWVGTNMNAPLPTPDLSLLRRT
jgi:uncharacterized membrane protein YfcA